MSLIWFGLVLCIQDKIEKISRTWTYKKTQKLKKTKTHRVVYRVAAQLKMYVHNLKQQISAKKFRCKHRQLTKVRKTWIHL